VAFAALELRYVTEIQRMLERLVALVTCGTLPSVLITEVYGVLERTSRRRYRLARERLVDSRVADAAVVPDRFAFLAEVLAVVAAETALRVEMADIVDVARPVRFHFREEICLVDLLHFGDGTAYRPRVRRI
jgi:hypothetical protein